MSTKDHKIAYLVNKIKDKDFKIVLNSSKLNFPISTSHLNVYEIAWITISHAYKSNQISKGQNDSFKNSLKAKYLSGEEYRLPDKVKSIYEYGMDYHVNLGELQTFFKKDYDNVWYSSIFNTKDTLIQSLKDHFYNFGDEPYRVINIFFKYLPYLKAVIKDLNFTADDFGYCCEDCDGDYDLYIRNKQNHLNEMAVITLANKIEDTYSLKHL